jgi:hypothetical protein
MSSVSGVTFMNSHIKSLIIPSLQNCDDAGQGIYEVCGEEVLRIDKARYILSNLQMATAAWTQIVEELSKIKTPNE